MRLIEVTNLLVRVLNLVFACRNLGFSFQHHSWSGRNVPLVCLYRHLDKIKMGLTKDLLETKKNKKKSMNLFKRRLKGKRAGHTTGIEFKI